MCGSHSHKNVASFWMLFYEKSICLTSNCGVAMICGDFPFTYKHCTHIQCKSEKERQRQRERANEWVSEWGAIKVKWWTVEIAEIQAIIFIIGKNDTVCMIYNIYVVCFFCGLLFNFAYVPCWQPEVKKKFD